MVKYQIESKLNILVMAQIPTNTGKPITPKQVVAQWRHLPHKLYVNIWNFEVKAGKAAQSIFQESFDMKRFNTSGSAAWPSRSKYSKAIHPLMVETGSLKRSIKWKHTGSKGEPSGVTIYTDPDGFKHTNAHRGFCYAAVHNGPSHFRWGRVKNMPRRQFMGHSSVLAEELKKLSAMIFQGFPK